MYKRKFKSYTSIFYTKKFRKEKGIFYYELKNLVAFFQLQAGQQKK